MSIPVLFLVFNRPQHTERVLSRIVSQQPTRIYVSGDGPRPEVASDQHLVDEVWGIIHSAEDSIPMSFRKLDRNHGCFGAVSSALDWFFQHESEGMVVEDDVLLAPGAIQLVEGMLAYAREDDRVGSVTAFNGVPTSHIQFPFYTFRSSIYSSSQAWGTWADRWQACHRSFDDWQQWIPAEKLALLGDRRFVHHWTSFLSKERGNFTETWDYLWLMSNWAMGRTTLVSNSNHSTNIGFDSSATFSKIAPSWYPLTSEPWDVGQWNPPPHLNIDSKADAWSNKHVAGISISKSVKRALASRVPFLHSFYRKTLEQVPRILRKRQPHD